MPWLFCFFLIIQSLFLFNCKDEEPVIVPPKDLNISFELNFRHVVADVTKDIDFFDTYKGTNDPLKIGVKYLFQLPYTTIATKNGGILDLMTLADTGTGLSQIAADTLKGFKKKQYTAYLVGSKAKGNIALYTTPDNYGKIPADSFRIRFLNLSNTVNKVDVTLDGVLVFDDVSFPISPGGVATFYGFKTFLGGQILTFEIRNAETGTLVYTDDIQVSSGKAYTYFLAGDELGIPPRNWQMDFVEHF
jgi:hypothetical protein